MTPPTNKHEKEQSLEKGKELVILAIKVINPKITDAEAENVIVNIGNYIQLKRLRGNE